MINNEFIDFKNEIKDDLKEFKKDITDRINEYKERTALDIKNSGRFLRYIEIAIAALLALILTFTIANKIQTNDTKTELYYTKRILEKTIMSTQFANLQQSKINAQFRQDTEAERQIDIEIEHCKNKMDTAGFLIIETTRGIVIADEK